MSVEDELKAMRPTRESNELTLFDVEPDWRESWWGMPEFSMQDASPQHRITINFMTAQDVLDFAKASGIPVTVKSDTAWFPHQKQLAGEYEYDGPKTDSRYPICIPSKGRADVQKTGKALDRMGVSYKFFVEDTEGDEYIKHLGADKVVVMPFHDLGQGSIPARNFIWEWAKERGFKRHWTVDDNITSFARMTNNRRLQVRGGGFFQAMEDYVDRFQNIVMAGPHQIGFVKDRSERMAPYIMNTRVYSCILLDTSLPDRWRGRYNEDTDLSLRLLKQGYCTMLFHSLLMSKGATAGVKNAKPMKGGNTDNVYNGGDHRLAFAQSLKDQHPDCVEVTWKFNRWHHEVDYSAFKKNRPLLKSDVTPTKAVNNYGMELVKTKDKPDFSGISIDQSLLVP
jgi:hypothetical protein